MYNPATYKKSYGVRQLIIIRFDMRQEKEGEELLQ